MLVRPLHRVERTGELTEAATVVLAMEGRAVVANMMVVARVSAAQSLAFNVNALRAGLDALPPGQEEIVLEVDEDGVQHINAE